ncbi:16S rRNA (guanine(527)-N(7))-methyltransferase RsmG [Meridianimarinicoccus roseus]|uniref:Ribosomal RNA small subunit methyltransferase G n=1 Tax=Meridianimarinicoccus roseus TaxID=2072018 RepID=A0A2V2LC44_9RHOB|nr:16S rRNA (guanine(527)-N(7))-methyltransferase RsmG [Meridianimarinicoccus roseus]PWR02885.1 16S rRNA (guanine(527)-N(7))-methyltransferase RsmG [Meridianimarinicoccus roseus]
MHNAAGLGDVSRETTERLEIFAGLLKKWTRKINLVAPGTISNLYERHIADSAQIFDLRPEGTRNWVDLGSGGGLPGAVIAILAAEAAPQLRVTCVESDQRKAVFLRAVSRETAVPFTVLTDRIESAQPLEADVLSARALAPLSKLLEFADRHLAEGGTMLFQKGAQHEKECTEAEKNWRFDREVITSCTDPNAVIYKIGALRRA